MSAHHDSTWRCKRPVDPRVMRRRLVLEWQSASVQERALMSQSMRQARMEAALEVLIEEVAVLRREVARLRADNRAAAPVPGVLASTPPVREILSAVELMTGITQDELLGYGRGGQVVRARHVACWLIAKLRPDMSLPQIGRSVRRDHSTVLHAIRRVDGDHVLRRMAMEIAERMGWRLSDDA